MSTRPEALRLAEAIDPLTRYTLDNLTCSAAATELRRLHAANLHLIDSFNALMAERNDLLEALAFCAGTSYATDANRVAQDAIESATGVKT